MRKLATIDVITGVKPIPEADLICAYQVRGWHVVDKVGKYQVGDMVVYCEPDSFLPYSLAPFLSKGKEPREYLGIKGEKLRTVRLKKTLSQGLILPISICDHIESELFVGLDVSVPLGIVKWEPPPEFASADAKGTFPSCCPKTDQERIENFYRDISPLFDSYSWVIEEKVDGSSMTVIFNRGEFSVCSRNLELKRSDTNTFWKTALKYDIENKLTALGKNIAIQGELLGPGINGDWYKLPEHIWMIFDVYDIDAAAYYSPAERYRLVELLGLTSVPIVERFADISKLEFHKFKSVAQGDSVVGRKPTREGVVFKANSIDRHSFKSVSNSYLLKKND